MAAAALVAITGSIVRGRTLVRAGPLRATAMSFAASSVLQAGEWLLLQSHPRFAACVIYLHVVGFGAIVLSGFWSVMNEHLDPRVAKLVLGRISGMGTLGGLAGGLVAAWMPSSGVVLALAILHLACAWVLWRGFRFTSAPQPSFVLVKSDAWSRPSGHSARKTGRWLPW
jgi:hypothetical protein